MLCINGTDTPVAVVTIVRVEEMCASIAHPQIFLIEYSLYLLHTLYQICKVAMLPCSSQPVRENIVWIVRKQGAQKNIWT
jgi:hypothetical protein